MTARMTLAALTALLCVTGATAACAPSGSGGAAPTTTIRADADGDGIPDVADPCPNDFDPDGYCPTTPYLVNDGSWSIGSTVRLTDVLVTDVDIASAHVVAAVTPLDAGYAGPDGAAVELDLTATALPAVGNRITVRGVVAPSFTVTVSSVTITG
jgi:hypothetical protein